MKFLPERCDVGLGVVISLGGKNNGIQREAAISQRELAQLDMIFSIQLCVLLGFVNGAVLMMSWTVSGIQF